MKNPLTLALLVVSMAIFSLGCTTTGTSSSWCRSGSLWPSSRTTAHQVYYDGHAGGTCDPCEPVCDPCGPAPCLPSCVPVGGILPSAGN